MNKTYYKLASRDCSLQRATNCVRVWRIIRPVL